MVEELLLDLVGGGNLGLVLDGAVAAAARVIGDNHRRFADVVGVVGFLELTTEPAWLREPQTRTAVVRLVRRIDFDSYGVHAGWHRVLAVTAVEDEVLPPELEDVGVGPAGADALETVGSQCAAV